MDYKKLSKDIADSFTEMILTYSDDHDFKESKIKTDIEDYGCDFNKPNLKLANSAIRCAMDYCGLDYSMIHRILKEPDDYGMEFKPLTEHEISMFNNPEKHKVYDPYLYKYGGKEYMSFSEIVVTKSIGVLRSTGEYNLIYCVTEDKWYGDVVKSGSWDDIDSNEALEIAKEYDLIFIAEETIKDNSNSEKTKEATIPPESTSLEEESHDAITASKEIGQDNSYHKQPPQKR